MSSSMCPHLVQEYFERVSEILVTYRPQILKQVEYDKISENLVLRGAVRPEEHERIDRCNDSEGKVSQMLVVVQNRMWGLENLLAAFMEEHVSSWLTQEMFRAYMEHLVNPMKKLQDSPKCHCVLMSNSMLYRGWVKALKSLDIMILKAGNSFGFMRQTMFPADNMLTFLSQKLAECTGGDSLSTREELVPYGFASNASGEVQVAELEEDDINDLITLSEQLSIGYPSHEHEPDIENEKSFSASAIPKVASTEVSPVQTSRKSPSTAKGTSQEQFPPNLRNSMRKRVPQEPSQKESSESQEKVPIQKQKSLIDRLSAPKAGTSSLRLRNSPSQSPSPIPAKPRPRSAELRRSASMSTTSSSSTSLKSPSSPSPPPTTPRNSTTGKATGFVRSRSVDPNSSKPKLSRSTSSSSPKTRPTAVAKPNVKTDRGSVRQGQEQTTKSSASVPEKLKGLNEDKKIKGADEKELSKSSELTPSSNSKKEEAVPTPALSTIEDNSIELELPQMSSLFLRNSNLSSADEHNKNLGYYQLNFDLDNE